VGRQQAVHAAQFAAQVQGVTRGPWWSAVSLVPLDFARVGTLAIWRQVHGEQQPGAQRRFLGMV